MVIDNTSDKHLEQEIQDTQIVIIAGGRAKRLGLDIPKCLLDIGENEKLIDKCITALRKEGFWNFIFLLGHRSDEVAQYIGDGSKHGIKVTYSIDPPSASGWGKGKAFRYALISGKIESSKRSLVVFPDDVIVDDGIFSRFLSHHIEHMLKNNTAGSMILVPGTEYAYGVAEIADTGLVTRFKEKPIVAMPTSVGVYAFEPGVYSIIHDKINMDDPGPVDLESTILPILVDGLKLSSLTIPTEKWLPINTLKEYEHAIEILSVARSRKNGTERPNE